MLQNISGVILMQSSITVNHFADSLGRGATGAAQQPASRRVVRTSGRFRAPAAVHGNPSSARFAVWVFIGPNASVCIDIGRVGALKNPGYAY